MRYRSTPLILLFVLPLLWAECAPNAARPASNCQTNQDCKPKQKCVFNLCTTSGRSQERSQEVSFLDAGVNLDSVQREQPVQETPRQKADDEDPVDASALQDRLSSPDNRKTQPDMTPESPSQGREFSRENTTPEQTLRKETTAKEKTPERGRYCPAQCRINKDCERCVGKTDCNRKSGVCDQHTGSCEESDDCPDNHICKSKKCVVGCDDSDRCDEGHICKSGSCIPGCEEDDDCPENQSCDKNNRCVP